MMAFVSNRLQMSDAAPRRADFDSGEAGSMSRVTFEDYLQSLVGKHNLLRREY